MSKNVLWYHIAVDEVEALLKTNIKEGLSAEEVAIRRNKYGTNALPSKKAAPWFSIALNQFKSPLIYILLIAALISLVLGELVDMWVILAAVFINAIVGFVQEYKAEKTLEHLQGLISYKAKVIRLGKEKVIESTEIVPGDIVVLEAGDRIPADGRIFESNDFQVNEASLTGESLPIDKDTKKLEKGVAVGDRINSVFMGTVVTRGRAKAMITNIGIHTHIGEIASLVSETKEERTPLQDQLASFSRKIGLIILGLALLILVVGVLLGHSLFEMFETSVALAVSAIPEGLIVSVTIILTVGMQRILKQKSLVRRLVAAETLGSTSIICTDKTGTLTIGKMRVAHALTGMCDLEKDSTKIDDYDVNNESLRDHFYLLRAALVCNNAELTDSGDGEDEYIGDPTETALFRAAIDAGFDYQQVRKEKKRIDEIPFSTEIKYMATLNEHESGGRAIYVKGAPEKILQFCSRVRIQGEPQELTKEKNETIINNIDALTAKGLRVLGVAYKLVDASKELLSEDDMSDLVFLGVFALKDPLRDDARDTIELTQQAGIRPIIITGDHKNTVQAIAKDLGFPVNDMRTVEGVDLDSMSDDELRKQVRDISIYARVSPKHKLRIVDAWQYHGESVAMIGDGVNDAPALKAADIGVALGSGTDVAKQTSDLILLDDRFSTIVHAVEQGRIIFDNIRKVTVYLLADSFSEIILILGALVFNVPLPITALQILYINLIADGAPSLALSFEPGEKDTMNQKPRDKDEPMLNNEMKALIFIVGVITDFVLLAVFFYLLGVDANIDHIRTFIFIALGIDSLFYVFSVKSLRHPLWQINIFNNTKLLGAVALGVALLILALEVPIIKNSLELTALTGMDWLFIVALALVKLVGIEITKYIFIIKRKHKRERNAQA